jgi:hypothetical protein
MEGQVAGRVPRTVEAVAAQWGDLLKRVRQQGKGSLQAVLRSCSPVAVEEERVTILAPYEFHRTALEQEEALRCVERALTRLMGADVTVRVIGELEPAELPAGLPAELADDGLARFAVEKLGAVACVRGDV